MKAECMYSAFLFFNSYFNSISVCITDSELNS